MSQLVSPRSSHSLSDRIIDGFADQALCYILNQNLEAAQEEEMVSRFNQCLTEGYIADLRSIVDRGLSVMRRSPEQLENFSQPAAPAARPQSLLPKGTVSEKERFHLVGREITPRKTPKEKIDLTGTNPYSVLFEEEEEPLKSEMTPKEERIARQVAEYFRNHRDVVSYF